MRRSQRYTLFPYTTLFRSSKDSVAGSLKFYKASYYRKKGQMNLAIQFLKDIAAQDDDLFNKTRAEFELIKLQLAQKQILIDRKSTRLNSSHLVISYAVFCL